MMRARSTSSASARRCRLQVGRGLHMTARGCIGLLLLSSGLAGCAASATPDRITEAADLAERQTGIRPEWSAPWDEQPPPWTDDAMLTREQAVVMALRNNRALRADLALIGQADADLLQAGLFSNPV